MRILVINCGSSSLKYRLFEMETEATLAKGLVERIGAPGTILKHQATGKEPYQVECKGSDHTAAMVAVLEVLTDPAWGVLKSVDEISAVGHRIVHGGERFSRSVLVDEDVIQYIAACSELAPLHNPPHIMGIRACQKVLPGVPMAVVFDTAFHQEMPPEAFMYAIPYELYEKYGIRRYGFHGTSHKYVATRAAELMGRPLAELKIITCHLGNGSSVAAVKGGRSIDTSMGFTPLEGLVMGTRCGDIDPAVVPFLMKKEGLTAEQVINGLFNKQSGVLGVSGLSHDFRDLEDAAADPVKPHKRAKLALEMFAYRLRKYIGAYFVAMGGLDALVFTAGIGENSYEMRARVCRGLECLGIVLDEERNRVRGVEVEISAPHSKVKIFAIPTNEELLIARETAALIVGGGQETDSLATRAKRG
ncbi:MAG: acetate/propionate family kinase [Bacillota bacterium]